MINLIPPAAKRGVRTEYRVRVLSVWLLLWSIALFAAALVLLPASELISSKVDAYVDAAALATEKVASYENASTALVQSSQQAKEVVDEATLPTMSSYIRLFEVLQGDAIEITNVRLVREGATIAPISLTGIAADRQTLASFRDRLLEQEEVTGVDLPISNLATDRDIQFTITVTLSETS